MKPAQRVTSSVPMPGLTEPRRRVAPSWWRSPLDRRPFRVLQRELQFLGKRVDRRAGALPGTVGFEPQVTDPAAPGCDDAPDGPEVSSIGVFLVETPDHLGGHPDEGTKRRCRLDAVLPAVPRAPEDKRD